MSYDPTGERPGMLPVHCCCTPRTRLGWVPRPRLPLDVAMFQVMDNERVERVIVTEAARLTLNAPTPCSVTEDYTTLASSKTIWAVKSKHEPIEVWRRVRGFVEDYVDCETGLRAG